MGRRLRLAMPPVFVGYVYEDRGHGERATQAYDEDLGSKAPSHVRGLVEGQALREAETRFYNFRPLHRL